MTITNILASNSINRTVGDGLALANGDLLNVFEGGYVMTNAAGFSGVYMAGSSQVMVQGQVFGPNMGIFAQGTGTWRQAITIGETGSVSGQTNGITAQGGDANVHVLTIQNAGQILALGSDNFNAPRAAIAADAVTLVLDNSGWINAHPGTGISVRLVNGRGFDLSNSGEIGGAIRLQNVTTDDIRLVNTGLIGGLVDLSSTTSIADIHFTNHGMIESTVALVGQNVTVDIAGGSQGSLDILAQQAVLTGANGQIGDTVFFAPTGDLAGTFLQVYGVQGSHFLQGFNLAAETALLDLTGARVSGGILSQGGQTAVILNGALVSGNIYTSDLADIVDATGALGLGIAILGAGNDTFTGGAADETVRDWAGNDEISLGAGNDRIEIEQVFLAEADDDIFDGGLGQDWIDARLIDNLYAPDGGIYANLEEGILGNRLIPVSAGIGRDLISGFENIRGSEMADQLVGDKGANVLLGNAGGDTVTGGLGADTLRGGDGNDLVTGGEGRDVMTGGFGIDWFWFDFTKDSSGTTRDVVTDFTQGTDIIHLGSIDADTTFAGNQFFTFTGTTNGGAGTVYYAQVRGDTVVYANTDADNAAEFTLILRGTYALTATNFVL